VFAVESIYYALYALVFFCPAHLASSDQSGLERVHPGDVIGVLTFLGATIFRLSLTYRVISL